MSCLNNHPYPVPRPAWPLRWFDSIGGNTYHNLSIFVCWLLWSERIASSTTPTTARRGTRFELLDGRPKIIKYALIYNLCVIYLVVINIIATFATDKVTNIIY